MKYDTEMLLIWGVLPISFWIFIILVYVQVSW
jgi:hypothetical protein